MIARQLLTPEKAKAHGGDSEMASHPIQSNSAAKGKQAAPWLLQQF